MSVKLTDNLDYKGRKPDFVRQQYNTVADMKSVLESQLPPMYLAYCLETRKVYLFNSENEDDEILGKFRALQGSGGNSSQVEVMPSASSSEYGKVYQYIGNDSVSFRKGWFYTCLEEEGEYYWTQISTGEVNTITPEEIEQIFSEI